MDKITKDTTINEILEYDSRLASIIIGAGIFYFGWPANKMITLEKAGKLFNIDILPLIDELNKNM